MQRAMKLDPVKSSMLQVGYGQALLATGKPELVRKAVDVLQQGLERDKQNVSGYQYLAQAYGRLGDEASRRACPGRGPLSTVATIRMRRYSPRARR